MPGPKPGSPGAMRIAEAHRGVSNPNSIFSNNPELAKEAGRKGGTAAYRKYGKEYYQKLGRMGGLTVFAERGIGFYSEIGRKGGLARGAKLRK